MLLHTLTGDPQWENIYFIQKHVPGITIGSYSPSAPIISRALKNAYLCLLSLFSSPNPGTVMSLVPCQERAGFSGSKGKVKRGGRGSLWAQPACSWPCLPGPLAKTWLSAFPELCRGKHDPSGSPEWWWSCTDTEVKESMGSLFRGGTGLVFAMGLF